MRTSEDGKNYYIHESVGIATGMLISACHMAGLATRVHTPSPMKFLNGICGRPETEKPFLILVAGHPADDAMVPPPCPHQETAGRNCRVFLTAPIGS
ncbi:MAG: iodotyrosine deiodinase [Hyphomonas sp.]